MERHQIEQQIRAALKKAECANGFHAHQDVMAELGHLCANHVADLLAPSPEARPTWQPIDERTPRLRNVIVLSGSRVTVGYWAERHDRWYDALDEDGFTFSQPTHWMPLPDPPAASAEKET